MQRTKRGGPYSVIYDVEGDKITALRAYMSMEQFVQQLKGDA
jgi:thioredoxin-related protein